MYHSEEETGGGGAEGEREREKGRGEVKSVTDRKKDRQTDPEHHGVEGSARMSQ